MVGEGENLYSQWSSNREVAELSEAVKAWNAEEKNYDGQRELTDVMSQ